MSVLFIVNIQLKIKYILFCNIDSLDLEYHAFLTLLETIFYKYKDILFNNDSNLYKIFQIYIKYSKSIYT